MPGDSVNLNIQAKELHSYDAIVIGSGISGGWAAKELCEKGLKVLVLERGGHLAHGQYPTANKHPWEFEHRNRLTLEDKQLYPVQSRHYSFGEDTRHFFISDQENPYEELKRFDWVRANIVGGRSILWARACYRWSDLDFSANLRDGYGVDWPIRYKDISPWYDYVESFIGVSGSRENLPYLPDGKFQPPFDMNAPEKEFKQRLEQHYADRKAIMGRVANLTEPVKGRGQCQVRNLCHRGCPWGAYFSSNASTIPAAYATGNLTVRPNSLVNRIIYDKEKQRATGVEVIDTETRQVMEFYARIIFVNAATVATTGILLHSTSDRFPNGLGNDSDQLGRNLMDHHKGVNIDADVEGFEDSYYYGRRPTGLYIPRYINIHQNEAGFLRGFHFAGAASRNRPVASGIGVGLKDSLTEPGPWQLHLYAYGECLPYPENRITLHPTKKDQWGRSIIQIDCEFKENEKTMHAHMVTAGGEMLESLGYKNVRARGELSAPGNANHEMGTARMGHDPKTSVLNGYNQMHAVKNVFVSDGSCMTSISCVNPSITFMALTTRACDYAVAQLKRGEI
jgi:choline dehydrogenase-like flavoprotein